MASEKKLLTIFSTRKASVFDDAPKESIASSRTMAFEITKTNKTEDNAAIITKAVTFALILLNIIPPKITIY